jgi:hypothetical protein
MMGENVANVKTDESVVERRRTIAWVTLVVLVGTYVFVLVNNLDPVREWLRESFQPPWRSIIGYSLLVVVPLAILGIGGAVLRLVVGVPVRQVESDPGRSGRIAGLLNCCFWGIVLAVVLSLTEEPTRTAFTIVCFTMVIIGFGVGWWWGRKRRETESTK